MKSPSTLLFVALTVAAAALTTTASAQVYKSRADVDKVLDRTIVFRMKDGANVHCQNNRCAAPPHLNIDFIQQLTADGAALDSCYGLPATQLRGLMQLAESRTGRPAPDLTQCFKAVMPQGISQTGLAAHLKNVRAATGVEDAYIAPRGYTPQESDTPNFSPDQFYLFDIQNEGMGFEDTWETHQALGAGVRVVDIEGDYNTRHEDLGTSRGAKDWPGNGTPFDDISGRHHGTASLGMVVAQHNDFGIDGLAPDAEPIFAPSYSEEFGYSVGSAILRNLQNLRAGDVILLEVHVPGPNFTLMGQSQFGLVPAEWYRAEFDAIRVATDIGVIIVEAGGNGEQNLDGPEYLGLFDRDVRDSGAIVVCAGNPPGGGFGPSRAAMYYTNYGSRCDVQSYGANLLSTGYGDLYGNTENNMYTAQFGGTSGASPLVTGSVAVLQSLAKSRDGLVLPEQMRELLVATGLEQAGRPIIGPMPDVFEASNQIDAYTVSAGPEPRLPRHGEACSNECDADLTCQRAFNGERFCVETCEPFGENTCPQQWSCDVLFDGTGACRATGHNQEGELCFSATDCDAGYQCDGQACFAACSVQSQLGCDEGEGCVEIGFGQVGRCATQCEDDGDCAGNEECIDGACQVDRCLPFVEGECGEGEVCDYALTFDGTTLCQPEREGAQAGERCRAQEDCASLHFCGQDGICYAFCSYERDLGCPDGSTCVGSPGEDLGYCFEVQRNPGGADDGEACASDADCYGNYCTREWPGGYCVSLFCEGNEDCAGELSVCVADPQGSYCLAGCNSNQDCREEYTCQQGFCAPGEVGGCVNDTDCNRGQVCVFGACADVPEDECEDNTQCPQGSRCVEGQCEEGCDTGAECGDGQACVNDSCEDTSTDCEPGCLSCAGDVCLEEDEAFCTEDDDCSDGLVCEDNACVEEVECTCPNGQICTEDGECIQVTAPIAKNSGCSTANNHQTPLAPLSPLALLVALGVFFRCLECVR